MPGVEDDPDRAAEDVAEHARADRRVDIDARESEARHQQDPADADAADQYSRNECKPGDP